MPQIQTFLTEDPKAIIVIIAVLIALIACIDLLCIKIWGRRSRSSAERTINS